MLYDPEVKVASFVEIVQSVQEGWIGCRETDDGIFYGEVQVAQDSVDAGSGVGNQDAGPERSVDIVGDCLSCLIEEMGAVFVADKRVWSCFCSVQIFATHFGDVDGMSAV